MRLPKGIGLFVICALAVTAFAVPATAPAKTLKEKVFTLESGTELNLVLYTQKRKGKGVSRVWAQLYKVVGGVEKVGKRVRVLSDFFNKSSKLKKVSVSTNSDGATITTKWFVTPSIGTVTIYLVAREESDGSYYLGLAG